MNIQDLVNNLDFLVENGRFQEAISRFFADNVITEGASGSKTLNKAEKISTIATFTESLGSTEVIKFHDNVVFDNKTISKFTFIFKANKQLLKWHELIERHWDRDKVTYEYYTQGSLSDLKKAIKIAKKRIKKEQSIVSTSSEVKVIKEPKDEKKVGSSDVKIIKRSGRPKKVSSNNLEPKSQKTKLLKSKKAISNENEVKSDINKPIAKVGRPRKVSVENNTAKTVGVTIEKAAKPKVGRPRKNTIPFETKAPVQENKTISINKKVTTRAKKTSTKSVGRPKKVVKVVANDFKVIQGIGPKIEEFLKESGIDTYEKLALADVDNMAAILLEKGGSRYNANSPATWPAQAELLVKSGLEELKKWQDAN